MATSAPRYPEGDATLTSPYELDPGPPPSGPARVGRYEICEVLGAGAMGVVYRARDPELDRDVAIKLVRDRGASPSSGVRLLREAQAMARLRHPNVLPIFDVGPADRGVFVAMPLLEGGTLRSWLDDRARAFDAILDRFAAAGRGLAAAHAAGLIHRDFKPDNVLLGTGGEVHVADFGLAQLVDGDPTKPTRSRGGTQTGPAVGTPAYMAPEQLRGQPSDARADQFSFCVALWEGLYGERPFPGPRPGTGHPLAARLAAIAAGPTAPPRRDRPSWLAPLLARGLAVDPERRWPSMQALLDAIAAQRGRRRWPRWLAGGLAAVGLAAGLVALGQPPPARIIVPAPPDPKPAPVPPARPVIPLAHYDDLKAAAVSPDGTQLALVTGDSLVIRGSKIGAVDRVVVERGIEPPIAWSPDGKHLLVGAVPERAGMFRPELVDIDGGAPRELPIRGMASFLSSTEIGVVASPRHREIAIYRLGEYAAPAATCPVPGDYTFLWRVAGLPDGTMVVDTEVLSSGSHTPVILGRDCRVRKTFSEEPFDSFAVTDTGTIVALVARDGFGEIRELSVDGAIVSRRPVSGALGEVIGRRRGIDYVTTLSPKTDLIRVQAGTSQLVFSTSGNVSFQLAPDGETLAWIERDGGQAPGPLWLSTLQDMRRSRTVAENALTVGWSPDGRRLAVLVADDARLASAHPRPGQHISSSLIVVDPSRAVPQRVPLADLDPDATPVWLDDHRIAARTDDRTTYRWFDLDTGEDGELVDRQQGSTLWLTRSPLDGTLAMWRMGAPDALDARAEHLWLQPPGRAAQPLRVGDTKHFLIPSWSRTGELLVRAFETGVVSRVVLATGELRRIATLSPTPSDRLLDDHVMTLASGDLLAVEHELGANVAVIRPDR